MFFKCQNTINSFQIMFNQGGCSSIIVYWSLNSASEYLAHKLLNRTT